MYNPYKIIIEFEKQISDFAGSKYAIAVDNCSAAMFLCCKWLEVEEVTIPKKTYVSVPCSVIHAGGKVKFENVDWIGEYQLKPYPIYDSACRLKRDMHKPGTYRCLSFQSRKHLPIGRGGMILTDDEDAAKWFKLARFHGRHEKPLMEDTPAMIGWNFYMDPPRAARGLELLSNYISVDRDGKEDLVFNYPDLSEFGLYES